LRNCVKVDQIEDPIVPVEVILKRCKRDQLLELYCIPEFKDSGEFLGLVAQKKGKLKKGGIPDYKATARIILQDWNSGKIPFYTIPPERTGVHVGASIVSTWGDVFNINDVISQEKSSVISTLQSGNGRVFMELAPGKNEDESQLIQQLKKPQSETDLDDVNEDISEDKMEEENGNKEVDEEEEDDNDEIEEMEEEEQEKTLLRPIKKKSESEQKKRERKCRR